MNKREIKALAKKYIKFFINQRFTNPEFPAEQFSNIDFYAEEINLIVEPDNEEDAKRIAEQMLQIWNAEYSEE